MNPFSNPKIYAESGVCIARSFRAMKRLLHYHKIRFQTFYIMLNNGEKKTFTVKQVPNGNFTGFGKGNKLHGKNRSHKSKYNTGSKVKYRIVWN